MEDTSNSGSISVKYEPVTEKWMHGLALPYPTPQSYELAISRMKRGGVELYHGQLYPTGLTSVISTFNIGTPTLTPSHP